MKGEKSIVFHLDKDLKIYELDLVNREMTPIVEVLKQKKSLELSQKFSHLWAKIYTEKILSAAGILLVIDQDAGFTDTRIIFIWLKSYLMFTSQDFLTINTRQILNEAELKEISIFNLQTRSKTHQLIYSSEPRIGKK